MSCMSSNVGPNIASCIPYKTNKIFLDWNSLILSRMSFKKAKKKYRSGKKPNFSNGSFKYYVNNSVMRVGSDTFGDPIFQNGLQN